MKKDLWSEEYQKAYLWKEDKKYEIELFFRGNSVRKHRKKSYHIIFNKPNLMDGHHELHLNAEYNDPSLMRNRLSFNFFSEIGVIAPNSSYVQLFINNIYQGIYLQLDSFDEYFLKRRKLPIGGIVYADDNDANFSLLSEEKDKKSDLLQGYTVKYDVANIQDQLIKLLVITNTLPDDKFQIQIQQVLHVPQYLKWLAGVVCTQNYDGFTQNYALYLNGDNEKFEITPWDYDGTWGRDRHGKSYEHDFIPLQGYNTLTARLLHIPEFRITYKQIMDQVLNNHFTVAHLAPVIDSYYQELTSYIARDPFFRYERAVFDTEPTYILNFIKKRNQFLMEECSLLN